MYLSIVVPAYNEEKLLPETLGCLASALAAASDVGGEIIVVNNASTDRTPEIARDAGARVIDETVRNIGRARNAGAAAAKGDVLVFIDADTRVEPTLFAKLASEMNDPQCLGGAVAVDFGQFQRRWMRLYSMGWVFWGKLFNMKGGAAQFCRRTAFEKLGGYDETIYLGEDVEFYWRLAKLARTRGGRLTFIEEPRVITSTRRFDKMSVWKTVVFTNPIYVYLNSRRASACRDWYEKAVR